MARKLKSVRLIVKNKEGHLHKLCRVSDDDDRYGEPFLKLMFYQFKKNARITKSIGRREIDGSLFSREDSLPPKSCNIECLSYHYIAGIRFLKTTDGDHVSEDRDFPKLQDAKKPVLICSFTLDKFGEGRTELTSRVDPADIVIDNVTPPCSIEFYISHVTSPEDVHKLVKHKDGQSHYLFSTTDDRTAVTVTVMNYARHHPTLSHGLFLNRDPYSWQKGIAWYSKPLFKLKRLMSDIFPKIFKNWP